MRHAIYTCQHVEGNPPETPIQPACERCRNPLRVLTAEERPHPTVRAAKLRRGDNQHERTPFLLKQAMKANHAERMRASRRRLNFGKGFVMVSLANYYAHQ